MFFVGCTSASFAAAPSPLSVQTLYPFGSNPKNPQGGLVLANDGNFYGTTSFGGTNGENGTVFRITPNGAFTSLFSFNGQNGSRPQARLVQATDGSLYGTTSFGGTNGDFGTIFKITLGGVFTPLFSFRGTDGSQPLGALFQGTDGNLYGTASAGGTGGNGTIFRISPTGVFALLYTFPSNGRNGRTPQAGLVQHSDGNFYGSTSLGGATRDDGTLFRITPSGGFASLFSFSGSNGSVPAAVLARGTDNNFYGTTQFGGLADSGTVFKFTAGAVLTTLFSFRGPDGSYPVAPLVLGVDGNFYGTTSGDQAFGGTNNFGTAFRITPAGALTTLSFFDFNNGASPLGGIIAGRDNNWYGTAFEGGVLGGGTVFRLVETPRFTAITEAGSSVTFAWASTPGVTYRVEHKPTLTALTWTALSPDIVATANRTSFTDNIVGVTSRFYRVRLVP